MHSNKLRLLLNISFCILAFALVISIMSFAKGKTDAQRITQVNISMLGKENFIEKEEVEQLIKQNFGELKGRLLSTLNLEQLEQGLKNNPYIQTAQVHSDINGEINIAIEQRKPILRIINEQGQDFYIDADGRKMPTSPNLTANVIVATGAIKEYYANKADTLNTPIGKELYTVAAYLRQHPLWNAQIEQLDVDAKQDIIMVPRVGEQTIILGNADSVDVKMDNLLIFYKKAMPKIGWDTYKVLNLKYTNQVVATRADGKPAQPAVLTARDTARIANKAMDAYIKNEINKAVQADGITPPEAAPAPVVKPAAVKKTKPALVKTKPIKAAPAAPKAKAPAVKKAAVVTAPKAKTASASLSTAKKVVKLPAAKPAPAVSAKKAVPAAGSTNKIKAAQKPASKTDKKKK